MKPYREQNYYELLEVSPNASPLEIRRAYKTIFDLYQDESIASYSFFSQEERNEILSLLEEAYLTVINPELREAYDRKLIELGLVEEGKQYCDKTKEPVPIYDFKKTQLYILGSTKRTEDLRSCASEKPVIQKILAQETLAGTDLKRIRTELEITLEEIAAKTNVRMAMLRAIEEEAHEFFLPMVYMKGILKSYARYLQVDENIIVNGFIKHIAEGK
ncbi:MAG: helix-turn-helix domain-containing protein [Deltaproteobacteria bacterium]